MIQIRASNDRVLQLDATTQVNVSRGATVATHPMEVGAPAVDHVEPHNAGLTIVGKITESPTAGWQENTDNIEGYNITSVTAGLSGIDRVHAAADFLSDCMGQFVDVVSSEGRFYYVNCLLTDYPNDFSIMRGTAFTLQFVLPRLVEVEWATIPRLPPTLKKEEEAGTVDTQTDDTDSEAPDVSLVKGLVNAATGGAGGSGASQDKAAVKTAKIAKLLLGR